MNIVLFLLPIIFLVLLFLLYKFSFEIFAVFDGIKLNGYLSIKIFKIRIINLKIHVGKLLNIKKTIYIAPFIKIEKYKENGNKFLLKIFKKINISEIDLFLDGGIKENAFYTAIITSSFLTFLNGIFGGIDNVIINSSVNGTFKDNMFMLSSRIKLKLSLIQILISMISVNNMNKIEKRADNNSGE